MKKNIKKVFVSLLVIIGFAFYGTYQRFGDGLQKFFDNLQTRQVAAESYSNLEASSSKNQTSSNPPLNISKNTKLTYPESPVLSQTAQKNKLVSSESAVNSLFKDGEFDGQIADAYYGFVQVRAIIELGKLADVQFLSYPDDKSYSIEINKKAMLLLEAAAIKNQSARVDVIAGATNTSNAFMRSLGSALSQANISPDTVSFLQTINLPVNIVSGATNVSSVTAATDGAVIQNQGASVDIVSGATNVSSVTAATGGAVIQNQGASVDIVSGATNVSSVTSSGDENETEYADEVDSDDKYENESDEKNKDEHVDEKEDEPKGEDD
jgi:uncharacterized protein with FMN-binding domain